MSFTRAQWASAFLNALGNPHPSGNTIDWVVAWTDFETSGPGGGGTNNLLNTTQPGFGGSPIPGQSAGVMNYPSFLQGVQANAKVLQNGLYPNLLAALQSDNYAALTNGSVYRDLGTWCGGCAYGPGISNLAGAPWGVNQVFPDGTATGVTPQSGTQQSGSGGGQQTQTQSALTTSAGTLQCNFQTPLGFLNSFLNTMCPVISWVANPVRIVKMVVGILLVIAALFLLLSPDAIGVAKKVAPFL